MTKGREEICGFQEQVGKLREVRGKEKITSQIGRIMEHHPVMVRSRTILIPEIKKKNHIRDDYSTFELLSLFSEVI